MLAAAFLLSIPMAATTAPHGGHGGWSHCVERHRTAARSRFGDRNSDSDSQNSSDEDPTAVPPARAREFQAFGRSLSVLRRCLSLHFCCRYPNG